MSSALLSVHMRVFAALVLLALVAWVANLVRHHRLSLRDSLLWLLSTGMALVVTVFPGILFWATRILEVEVPANALFALTFLYILANLLSLTIVVSTNSARVRRLTQECALLRAELERAKGSRPCSESPAGDDQSFRA